MYRIYCIEMAKKDEDKADSILEKYCANNDIDIKYLDHSRRNGIDTVQYWFTCTISDDIEVIVNELKANGIDVF